MTKTITATILANRGQHPDRLTMHPATGERLLGETDYGQFMLSTTQWRDEMGRPLFYRTPIAMRDPAIPRDVVIFEQGDDLVGFQETHRLTLDET